MRDSEFSMRWLSVMLAVLLSVSLTSGVMAHAAEPIACIDSESASALGHFEGDRDEVPSDAGKSAPHHHAPCHAHQIAEPARDNGIGLVSMIKSLLPLSRAAAGPSTPTDPAYRPPRA